MSHLETPLKDLSTMNAVILSLVTPDDGSVTGVYKIEGFLDVLKRLKRIVNKTYTTSFFHQLYNFIQN